MIRWPANSRSHFVGLRRRSGTLAMPRRGHKLTPFPEMAIGALFLLFFRPQCYERHWFPRGIPYLHPSCPGHVTLKLFYKPKQPVIILEITILKGMSYLNTPRLIFAGDFLSDVSTVNNDPAHYNNETFEPGFQEYGEGGANGSWNPEGGAVFNFQDCSVRKLVLKDGSEVATGDFTGLIVKGAEGRATGKMVDLDPQQQGCSELWAVRLRILTKGNDLILEGTIQETGFRDLQLRQHSGAQVNGQPLGGTWTSVLIDLAWGEKAAESAFFDELKNTTQGNRLSINLNAFGYYYRHAPDGRFSLGKILGAIGPWFEGEPKTFAPCRRLYGTLNVNTLNRPQVFFSNTNFLFDKDKKQLTIDFGSSFPVADSQGSINYDQKLFLAVSHQKLTNGINTGKIKITPVDFVENYAFIGKVDYQQGNNWLASTGGIVSITGLSDEIAGYLGGTQQSDPRQLILLAGNVQEELVLIARESIDGYLLRADNFVQRLDYNQTQTVDFYACQWGHPLESARVNIRLQPPTPIEPKGPNNPISEIPGNNYPRDGIRFQSELAIHNGSASLQLTGNKIENPRGYIEGQMYFLDYELDGIGKDPAEGRFSNDNVFIHLRDYFEVPDNPVWEEIEPIMTQFANLYPIMSKYIVDLKDPQKVIEQKDILTFAFSRDARDPLCMPVTRDLPDAKRQTILKWLANPQFAKQPGSKGDHDIIAESKVVTLASSPAKTGQALTERQQNLKDAMRAKSGALLTFDNIDNLKF
jgi:hypothetical protein